MKLGQVHTQVSNSDLTHIPQSGAEYTSSSITVSLSQITKPTVQLLDSMLLPTYLCFSY